jgi:2-polyprenyl-3-methyl-5-hydroxy-6-metoxy-1,4-benzoquinol methylase
MTKYIIYGQEMTYNATKKFIFNYYDKVKNEGYKHRTAHVLDLIEKNDNPVKILDYGCGWGIFSKIISEKSENFDVTGIDLDDMSLKISQEITGEKENLYFLNKKIFDFDEKMFDYVISMQVIEHVHNPGNYLKEINRVLKDNGKLVISLPNVMQPISLLSLLIKSTKKLNIRLKERSLYILKNYKKEHDHIHAWDPNHFVTFVSSLGFEVEEVRMVEGVPMPFIKYWYTKIFGIKNLSYKMVFKLKKVKFIDIANYD